ncbi:MAG: hypothetical protein C0483_07700 [Pirellula sp.]|nr:hypothetical protein [Pirellula sp.]
MRGRYWWAPVLLTAALVGCETQVAIYDLRLAPTADGLQRTLTAWREQGGIDQPNKPLSDEELKRLGSFYPKRVSTDADIRQSFRGVFLGKLPADVGGRGSYEVAATVLGTSYTYLERFRGATALDAELYDRRAAADRCCDLVVAWFDKQLADAPERQAVRRFLNQEFREDLRNLAAIAWLAAAERSTATKDDDKADEDVQLLPTVVVRMLAYLVEHDYLAAHETRSIAAELQDDVDRWQWLRRMLARKSGLEPSAADRTFAFLEESESLYASWNEHLRATPEYARIRKQAQGRPSKDGESDGPEPKVVLEQLLEPTLEDFMATINWGSADELRLALVLPVAPHETNGDWEPSEMSVYWKGRLRKKGGSPTVCYALWTVADEKFQLKHFGRTVIEGDELAQFAAMHRTLTAQQRAEFDKHLEALEPGDAIKGRVQEFQFVGAADEAAKRTARRMVELLASEL